MVTEEEADMEWEEPKGGGDKDDAEGFSWDQLHHGNSCQIILGYNHAPCWIRYLNDI